MLHLEGGNDGLNTLISFNDEYARYRSSIRIAKGKTIRLNDDTGLHPQLQELAELYQQGNVAIIQGIGYPRVSRSHHRSLAAWDSANTHVRGYDATGWLGRTFAEASNSSSISAIYVGNDPGPIAFHGSPSLSISQADVEREFSIQRGTYPDTEIGTRLQAIAQLIKQGAPAKAYYTRHTGYDTHVKQLPTHAKQLGELSQAITAFQSELQQTGLADNVTLVAFSEFGRSVAENDSFGTDHGTAGVAFVVGDQVRGGIVGSAPTIDRQEIQLRHSTDFRSLYATLSKHWLGTRQTVAELQGFPELDLFSNRNQWNVHLAASPV